MDTRRITSLALIVPPVVAMIGWFVVGFVVLDGVGPDDPQKFIAELGANSTAIKYLFPLITLLFLMAIGGLGYIKKSMEGGPGSYIASFGWFLVILGSAGQLGEVASTLALAEASDNAATAAAAGAADIATVNSAVASSMYAAGQAIGAVTTAFSMVGFALFGVGILQQKNFSPLVAGLIIVAGIYTAVMCLIDYENPLIAVGFIGIVVSFIALGVSLLNQKD